VPTYRLHQEWLGNERYYSAMWKCWAQGDIKGARAALSDEACDRLYIHGTPDECRARIQEYFDAGLGHRDHRAGRGGAADRARRCVYWLPIDTYVVFE
jgi:alkanesulfonate monooxygenase SsuD/methylene tetrahydromethanopterin reductase-like flavin-dependent oxidoreductase (luciferase family)